MSEVYAPAPVPSFRLIPSRFPPIGLFDTVSTAADLEAVMELAGWTNDRLVAERIARLPRDQWVFGRPNASVVMAAFLHVAPQGTRFNRPELGAWYASASLKTAIAEVGHHLRRETVAVGAPVMTRQYRTYTARIEGAYLDLVQSDVDIQALYEPASYAASQAYGETVRAAGDDGLLVRSVRHEGGVNVVAYRPTKVLDVTQTEHFELRVAAENRQIEATRLMA